jgi:TET-associated glycosyltransferase-like protein
MRIYIPTRGRIGNQRTLMRLPDFIHSKYNTTLVCPEVEAEAHGAMYPYLHIIGLPVKLYDGIMATRNAIMAHALACKEDVVVMIDDDLPTWCQRIPGGNKYRKADDRDIGLAFSTFHNEMMEYAHGAIGHRLFCQEKPPIYYNSRPLRVLAYNLSMVNSYKFRTRVMEDFDMSLQLLRAGYDSIIYNDLVQDQYSTNTPGGCSSYRSLKVQEHAAKELKRLHPDYVTVVKRAPKREWVGLGGERTDVRVNWAKAAKDGGCKHAR